MAIQFDLTKDKSAAPIAFALSKVQAFIVELYWESKHDLDAHAIALANHRYTSADDILSTYNPNMVLLDDRSKNHTVGGNSAFTNQANSLVHMGDKRTGLGVNARDPDEVLRVNLSNLGGRDEVGFFVTMHPPCTAKFSDVDSAKLVIKDDTGAELLVANLTHDFDAYDMVQMGSIVKNAATGAWDFNPVANGVNGTFNDILAAFA